MLHFRGSLVISDAELLASCELDNVLDSRGSTAADGMSASNPKRLDQAVKHRSDGRECREPSTPSHLGFQQFRKRLPSTSAFIPYSTSGVRRRARVTSLAAVPDTPAIAIVRNVPAAHRGESEPLFNLAQDQHAATRRLPFHHQPLQWSFSRVTGRVETA